MDQGASGTGGARRCDLTNAGMIEEGKGLFESVGCKGCHAIDPDAYGTPVGYAEDFKPKETRTAKDFAPNLDNIAEKTDARWVWWWIKRSHQLRGASRDALVAAERS